MRKLYHAFIVVALMGISLCGGFIYSLQYVHYNEIHNIDDGSRARALLASSIEAQRRDDIRATLYGENFSVWSGEVVSVQDGDSISVYHRGNRRVEKVRLWGIDAPEIGQDFGDDAKRFVADTLTGKRVDVVEIGGKRDRYGRIVAVIELDGESVNEELIREGLAWVYPKYCALPVRTAWDALEADARAAKRGLWAGLEPVEPWTWRQGRKGLTDHQ